MSIIFGWGIVFAIACWPQDVTDEVAPNKPDGMYALEKEWDKLAGTEDGTMGNRADAFAMIVQSRLKSDVPSWWRILLRTAEIRSGNDPYFDNASVLAATAKRWNVSEGVKFSGFDTIALVGKQSRVRFKMDKCELVLFPQIAWQEPRAEWATMEDRGIAGVIIGGRCIVAPLCPSESPGGPTYLYCFQMGTGKLMWKSTLVTGMPHIAYNRVRYGAYTEVTVKGQTVIVWSGHEIAATVQAFDITDGSVLSRFSTNADRVLPTW